MNAVSPEQAGFCIPPSWKCWESCAHVCNLFTLSGITPALPMFSQCSGSWRSLLLPRLLCQPLEKSDDETSASAARLKSTWGRGCKAVLSLLQLPLTMAGGKGVWCLL